MTATAAVFTSRPLGSRAGCPSLFVATLLILLSASAASAAVDPSDDIHGSGAYRRALLRTLVERALKSAA